MSKPVVTFIIILLAILGITYMITKSQNNSKKSADIFSNVKDKATDTAGDIADDLLEDADGETAPPDEFDDRAATNTDVDDEDENIVPLDGGDEEDEEGYTPSGGETDATAGGFDSKEVIGGAYTEGKGDYMVIAGAFSVEGNANKELQRIRDLGYPQAEVVKFDFSDYYSVCVARYEANTDATKVAKSLKSRYKVNAYVHKRRSKNG